MLTNIIEAMLFASGSGLTKDELLNFFAESYSSKAVFSAIDEVIEKYNDLTAAVIIKTTNGRIQMQTNPIYGETISELLRPVKEKQLSKSLLESLSIIAYKQPITKMELEDIRRVNSDYAVNMLEDANLIYKAGQRNTIGRPFQYCTTDEFLKKFGLGALDELPDYNELLLKIKNNFDKFYEDSESLYRNRNVLDEEESVAAADADDEDFFEDEDELPDFLKDEDVVEVD